jgi:hypothetical protein
MKNVAPIQLDQFGKIKVMLISRTKVKVNTQNKIFTISTPNYQVPTMITKPIKL